MMRRSVPLVFAIAPIVVAIVWIVLAHVLAPGSGAGGAGPPIPADFNGKRASTTAFAFGSSTACVCNGAELSKELIQQNWFGCAVPDWLLTPFLDRKGQPAEGHDTPRQLKGQQMYSNCGVGAGGCGSCWQLETTGDANIDGRRTERGKTMNVVVVDACEDRNAYGNNTQWCIAATNVPPGGINTRGAGPDGFGEYLRLGVFDLSSPDVARWSQKDCVSADGQEWTCTNLAGQPAHFDIAMDDLDPADIEQAGAWKQGENPIVTIQKVECTDGVRQSLRRHCGANAAPGAVDRCFWCPADPAANQGAPGSMPSSLPAWWGGCGPDEQRPECAPMNAQCGGEGFAGPTCCQWPDHYVCERENRYFSGCVPVKKK